MIRTRRLSFAWHHITPEFAKAVEMDDDLYQKTSREPLSKAIFELEPVDDQVKLTVIHTGFEPGSAIRAMVGDGWIQLISDLKSFVESTPELASTK